MSLDNEPSRLDSLESARPTLLIVGASSRAAAVSAIRAGLSVETADMFADEDLRRMCVARRIEPYPDAIIESLADSRADAWLYTGGIENHPQLVARGERIKPLWGNSAKVLRAVRNPERLAETLRAAGIAHPAVALDAEPSRNGSWIEKPFRSCGGRGMWRVDDNARSIRRGSFRQAWIDGTPCSALFVAARRTAMFLGMTRQLIGGRVFGAREFQYCGSIGPLTPRGETMQAVAHIGQTLAAAFPLVGLFGVDLVMNDDGVWPIEVNPRYVASIEVLESTTGVQTIDLHRKACVGELLVDDPMPFVRPPLADQQPSVRREPTPLHGKAIVYARCETIILREHTEWLLHDDLHANGNVWADIPSPGTAIRAGEPIVTAFASGTNELETESKLGEQARRLYERLSERTGR